MIKFSRRRLLRSGSVYASGLWVRRLTALPSAMRTFDVASYGAVGDGRTLDTQAIQQAINAAAAHGSRARVLLRGGRRYLVGTLELKGAIDFHLADDATLLLSLSAADYRGGAAGAKDADRMASALGAAITANGAQGLTISGTGSLQGRAREFMERYDSQNEWWIPKAFRPKMFVLTGCRDLEVRDITFAEAPNWGLHLLGCEDVLVDNVTVRNLLDVPNCDGIDPDHSRRVQIRNCDIVSGDDGIVVKTSRQTIDYGPAAEIKVQDCTITTQDAGLKIGTETTAEIHDVVFERCHIKTSSRGLGIQLRDEGDVYNVQFKDITLEARFFSDPWWGRGEAISFTAIPRRPGGKLGSMHDISVQNVTCRAENSVRLWGSPESPARNIVMERVGVTLDRWTKYQGGVYDNRPTSALAPLAPSVMTGFDVQNAENVALRNCKLTWGAHLPAGACEPVVSRDVKRLQVEGLREFGQRPSCSAGESR